VLTGSAVGYGCVYMLELLLLFVALATIGPLVRLGAGAPRPGQQPAALGLADILR